MGNAGHPYAHFRRALEAGNFESAWAYATELPVVSLADALQMTLLAAEKRPDRYPPLSRRWIKRFCTEREPAPEQLALVALLLGELAAGHLSTQVVAAVLGELL